MASHWCSPSDVPRLSQSSDMLNQGTVVEKAHESEKTAMEVQVKKEKTENENQGGCDVSRPSLFSETSYKGLNRLLELAKIKEERKGTQSPSDDPKCATEARATEDDCQGNEKASANTRKTDGARDDGRIQVTSETSSQNKMEDSSTPSDGNMAKKRTLYELYAAERSLQNDLGKLKPNHARTLEAPTWHQDREGEREREHTEKIALTQYINSPYADGASLKRIGIRDKPLDYRLDGRGCKPGSRMSDQIHESTAYLPLVDPRNRKFFITEEPRTRYFREDQTHRSLQEELLPRAWHPKYGVMYNDPESSEYYSKNESKRINHIKEDVGSQSKERFERRYRLQADSYWPYLERSAGIDDGYDEQGIAFLRVEHPVSEQRNHQTKTYHGYSTEQRPGSTPSTEEYVKYVPVPNSMLIPTQNSEYVFNGRHDIPYDMDYQFPVAGKGGFAFLDKDKVFYPCCNEEIPAIHYDNMVSKARWFETRNAERQRLDAIQALKAGVAAFSGSSQPQVFLNDVAIKGKSNNGEGERFTDVPFPVSTPRMHQEFLSEEAVSERFARRIDGDRRPSASVPSADHNYKGDKVSERNANGETTSIVWQQKVNGSRISKEMMGSKTWETSKEERTDLLQNKGSEGSGNKLVGMDQVGTEGTNELQDPKNGEIQPKISQEEAAQHQDDHSPKKISCSVCKKTFNRTSNLYTHMRTHSANKPHACEFCGKRFHQKADLRIHRYIHTGEKPHKCTKCGRGFKQLTHLKYHMRTHSDVRMYKCPYCEKGFNQKSNLQAHIFGHTGQRPHKCETCGKGFTLASTLNTHKRTHLPNKPFKCEFCDRAFYQKNALKMHYVSTHPYSSGACLV